MFVVPTILGSVTLFLVMFFVVIPLILGRVSGWSRLGAEYRLTGRFEGKRWWFQDVTLRGWCGYNGGVSVGANADGLYLNTIFYVSHPPLFIPWCDLSVVRRDIKFLGIRLGMVEFATQRVPSIRLALRESLLKKIAAANVATLPTNPHDSCEPASPTPPTEEPR